MNERDYVLTSTNVLRIKEQTRDIKYLQSELRKHKKDSINITSILLLCRELVEDNQLGIHLNQMIEVVIINISSKREQLLTDLIFTFKIFIDCIETIEKLYMNSESKGDTSNLRNTLDMNSNYKIVKSEYDNYIYKYFNTKAKLNGNTVDLDREPVLFVYNEIRNSIKN